MESLTPNEAGNSPKNGKDPVMEELHDIKVRLQSIEDYLEEIVERLSEAGVNFGDGFEVQ